MSGQPTIEALVRQLISEVRGLKKEITEMKREKEREHWVNGFYLREFTGWSGWHIKEARRLNWVKHRKVPGTAKTYEYDLNSIEERYLNKQTA